MPKIKPIDMNLLDEVFQMSESPASGHHDKLNLPALDEEIDHHAFMDEDLKLENSCLSQNDHDDLTLEDIQDITATLDAVEQQSASKTSYSAPSSGLLESDLLAAKTRAFELQVAEALQGDRSERLRRLKSANPVPRRLEITTFSFDRNPDVVAEVLFRAKGVCSKCGNSAPFRRRSDGSPYLEVHHVKSLAEGGQDNVENTVALCPNCHRYAHHA